MTYIIANPGVYLRELSEDLGLSMGVVEYHVWGLVKDGEVEDFHNGRFRRFFGTATYGEMEQKVISLMRQETPGKILSLLLEDEPLTHVKLAATLGVTSQALTWQMTRLRAMGIIETSPLWDHTGTAYHLNDGVSGLVSQHLHRGPESMGVPNASNSTVESQVQPIPTARDSHHPSGSRRSYCYDHFIVEPAERRT